MPRARKTVSRRRPAMAPALICRLVAVAAMMLGLWGPPLRRTHEAPRYLVYLVDGSASIDEQQTAWMAERIASLEQRRPRPLERALIVFGGTAHVAMPFGREPLTGPAVVRQALSHAPIDRAQTSLQAGVLQALALLPAGHHGSAVLLSDGRETFGNVTALLGYAKWRGLSVFPQPVPVFGSSATVWEDLIVPPVVGRGSVIPLQLVVVNGAATTTRGEIAVALEGVVIKRQSEVIRPGWQVLTVTVPAIRQGTVAMDVALTIAGNRASEQRSAYTEVEGPPEVLWVTDRPGGLPALAAALRRRGMKITVLRPDELSASGLRRLPDHDVVVLFNVPKSALSSQQVDALRSYLTDFGGGLVTVGLGGELAREVTTPAPLDALLPVRFEPKGLQESQRRVCMMLLIDRSMSMVGPRIAATKRAAVELVKQLQPEDLVGVLAFDTQPYVVAEVQQAGQLAPSLVEKLVKLRSSGGTDILPALAAANNRLDLSGATVKHIILLSDGITPFQSNAYQALIESFRQSHITVSTIGIGAAFINIDYLTWLARSTGGMFYQMRSLDELPQLVARDTQRSLEALPFTEGLFRPVNSPTTDWLIGTSDWPPLRGYLTATAKPEARVDLVIERTVGLAGDAELPAMGGSTPGGGAHAGSAAAGPARQEEPLLARWHVGAGRVVSFTSDADARWSPDWIRWPGFDSTWAQITRWAMRPRLTEELFTWIDDTRAEPRLMLEGRLADPKGQIVSADGSTVLPLPLVQTGAYRWQAPLEHVPSGWYQLSLASTGSTEQQPLVYAKRWIRIGTPPTGTEATGQPAREPLLRQIARSTDGVYDAPDRALVPISSQATTTQSMMGVWLWVAIIALLIDIALRGASML